MYFKQFTHQSNINNFKCRNTSAMQSQSIQLILSTKQEHLNQIRNDIEQKIMSDLSCSKRRWYILELLMMEGLFKV